MPSLEVDRTRLGGWTNSLIIGLRLESGRNSNNPTFLVIDWRRLTEYYFRLQDDAIHNQKLPVMARLSGGLPAHLKTCSSCPHEPPNSHINPSSP